MTFARVLKIRKPVPSNNFINDPVRESRPSGKSTNRPPLFKYPAIRLTAYGDSISTGKVRRLTMMRRCAQLILAEVIEVTNRQSFSRQTPISNQSHHET